MKKLFAKALCFLVVAAVSPFPLIAEQVGNVDVDWLGNDIVIEAFNDPMVAGVTCHVAYFDRGVLDRLKKGKLV